MISLLTPTYKIIEQSCKANGVAQFPEDPNLFHRKLTLIFGGSNTGKTTIVRHILRMLKERIPLVFIISPTNSCNNSFTGLVPPEMIKESVTPEWLDELWKRQSDALEVYNKTNDIAFLSDMVKNFSAGPELFEQIKTLDDLLTECKNRIDNLNATVTVKKRRRGQALAKHNQKILEILKTFLRSKRKADQKSLSLDQRVVLNYLDIVPDVLLLMDDCASEFKGWSRNTNSIKRIFYAGRQKFFTTIITTQDDKEIDSELRKNAMVNIFTSPQAANANFDRVSNSYSKQIRDRARKAVDKVFNDQSKHPHRKLVYLKEKQNSFMHWTADLVDDFRMCNDTVWTVSQALRKDNDKLSSSNAFVQSTI